ncbi:NAD-dependent epimerase [Dyadobacter luteus]|uniref:UDP-glucose 4-epimerase n=1 Tax=Dyadobacter luteus TaxID=2259619 RepID=A0A3D8YE59_9BACT|nr:NAD-dependent epimerase/dehydratase family protein [Dyadobacter luteus]REA62498.1 NAD-dependent epimerase [Dyadobacter luteus]
MRKKCLLIGGGGFIGSNLAKGLLSRNYDVRIFDVKNFNRKNISSIIQNIEIFEGDFFNPVDIKEALKNIDFVYHLVSSTIPSESVLNPTYDIETNVIPSIRLLQTALETGIRKVVFTSSGGTVYGIPSVLPIPESHPSNPISSYGIAKRTIESYINLYNKLWGLDACIFRLSNPYGENQNPQGKQGVIPIFLYKALTSDTINVWGDGEVVRDYIHIDDVTHCLIKSIEIDTPEIVYNLGSGVGTSINEIINTIRKNINKDVKVDYMEGRNFDVPVNILDNSLLKSRFKISGFTDLDKGLNLMFAYLKGVVMR